MTIAQGVLRTEIALTSAIVLFVMGSSLARPMGLDHGIFAWTADSMLRGEAPYAGAWEVKGPVIYWLFALAEGLFGHNYWGIRIVELSMMSATLVAVFRLMRQYADDKVALASAALLAFTYYQVNYWNTAQADSFAAILLVWVLCLLGGKRPLSTRKLLLAGLLIAALGGMKWLYLVSVVPFFLMQQLLQTGDARSRRIAAAWLAGGLVGGLVLIHAALAWQGGLAEYLDIQFNFLPSVHMRQYEFSPRKLMNVAVLSLSGMNLLWWFALLIVPTSEQDAGQSRFRLWLCSWLLLLATVAVAVIQNKFYAYLWMPAYLMLIIIANLGLARAREIYIAAKPKDGQANTVFAIWLFALLLAVPVLWEVQGVGGTYVAGWKYLLGRLSRDEFLELKCHEKSLLPQLELADYLQQHTKPDDTIQVWGFDALLYAMSDRKSATRFGYNYPLVGTEGTPYYERYRREFLAELTAHPPAYILIGDNDRLGMFLLRTSTEELHRFPEFESFLKEHYQLETTLYNYALWRRK